MRNPLSALIPAMAVFALLALAPSSLRAADITLRYANFPPAATFPCVQMERWKQEVEKRTGGAVSVRTFPGSTLLGAKNMFRGVQQGQADIGCLCMSYQPGVFPLTTVADLPAGFSSAKVASRTLWDLYTTFQPEEFKKVKVLTMFTSAPSNIMSEVPVKSLADLRGLEIRASGTPSKVLGLLGATPVSMPMSETPEALQKGVVKGLLSSLEVLKDFNFAETCRHETITNFPVYPFAVVMNLRTWNSLPENVQKVMDDLAAEQAEWTGQYMDRHVQESLEWSRQKYGVKVYELSEQELEAARTRTAPLIQDWKNRAAEAGVDADKVLETLYSLKSRYEEQYAE
ncbi:MAG: TRAP transporter substrate-binding protein [Desulfovibrionaceae bacterium]